MILEGSRRGGIPNKAVGGMQPSKKVVTLDYQPNPHPRLAGLIVSRIPFSTALRSSVLIGGIA